MSEVTLQVGGRPYTISCADGEEDHVRHLARIIDGKLTAMGTLSSNDAKNLLFAALILADEVDEARRVPAQAPDSEPDTIMAENVVAGLELLAGRLEEVADLLENRAAPS
ncbi:cell division protein ZapA [Qipengyuania sp.]|uniref:cell division protein ZapA n=1 Tax=Qipengyuania sp. TaxID=2004515 RepID=UPI0035C82B98